MKRLNTLVLLGLLVFQACSSSKETARSLSAGEKQKLDPQLHYLYENPSAGPADSRLDVVQTENGKVSIGVQVFTNDAEKMKKMGVTVQSADTSSVVCRVDSDKLRQLLQDPSVSRVLARKSVLDAK